MKRADEIVWKALNAFWVSVAEDHPRIKSGDFPPWDTEEIENAARRAINTWVRLNRPQPMEED